MKKRGRRKPHVLAVRCTAEYHAWAQGLRLVVDKDLTMSQLLAKGLEALAIQVGHHRPAPPRVPK